MRRISVCLVLAACAPPPPPAAPAATTADSAAPPPPPSVEEKAAEAPADVPTGCEEPEMGGKPPEKRAKGELCIPEDDYVKKLCQVAYPDVALLMLGRGSTFTRMYLRGDVDGWNAEGGASTRARLAFDEEVVVLKKRIPPPNAIVVNGAGYLVLRWDGNCYTLDDGELTVHRPPAVKHGPIPWRYYGERTKDALLQNTHIAAAQQKREKECHGVATGVVSPACEKADAAFGDVVVTEIHGGLAIPQPERRP